MENIDFNQLEQYHHQLENEITIRREQVENLRKELEKANMKIFDLTTSLEKNEKYKEELDAHMKLKEKNLKLFEEKNITNEELLNQYKMKYELNTIEIKSLHDSLQQSFIEKSKLIIENDELKMQNHYLKKYQQDNMGMETKIKAAIQDITTVFETLSNEQKKVMELGNFLKENVNYEKTIKCLHFQNSKLRESNNKIESKLIETKANLNKLEQLLASNSDINQENYLNKFIFKKWKESTEYYKKHWEINKKTIDTLTNLLKDCEETNVQLTLENEQYQQKLKQYEVDNNKESEIEMELEMDKNTTDNDKLEQLNENNDNSQKLDDKGINK